MRRFAVLVALCLALGSASGAAQVPRPTCFGFLATVVGSDKDDVMNGTDGPDVMVSLGGADRIDGADGEDRICSGNGDDIVVGGDGDDRINGGDDQDALAGGPGDDLLNGGNGNDNVAYFLAPGPVRVELASGAVTGGDGTDTLQNVEAVSGSRFGDTIVGDSEMNVLFGEEGDDTLEGGPHSDALVGGAGNDRLLGRPGDGDAAAYVTAPRGVTADLATGVATGEGQDTLVGIDDLIGSDHGDTLSGNADLNFLVGFGGDDVLRGQGGFDVAVFVTRPVRASLAERRATGEGSDRLLGLEGLAGSGGPDRLLGDGGQNYFQGREGDDIVGAGGGPDVVVGKEGDDTLNGGTGDDRLFGGPGNDVLNGGVGTEDAVSYVDAAAGVHVDLQARAATGEGADRLVGVEGAFGTPFADELVGDSRPNPLYGGDGDDVLTGGGGSDFLGGGAGTNTLQAGPGKDYCLDGQSSSGCELSGAPVIPGEPAPPPTTEKPDQPARALAALAATRAHFSSRADRLVWMAHSVARVGAAADRLALVASPAAPSASATGLLRQTAPYEYGAEPVCLVTRGRRLTEIAPPKVVRPVGEDGKPEEAWWQGTLFRRVGSGYRRQAKTPWARAQLAGGFVLSGVLVWKDASGRRSFRSPVAVRVQKGRYVWKGQIYWVRSGGRIFAPIEPHIIRARTIRHDKQCTFR